MTPSSINWQGGYSLLRQHIGIQENVQSTAEVGAVTKKSPFGLTVNEMHSLQKQPSFCLTLKKRVIKEVMKM